MAPKIEGEIVIGRPIDEVFDFVADERNEPKYNPGMLSAEKLSTGPIGEGTRFRATIKSKGKPLEMLLETTAYERPSRLGNRTSMSSAEISGSMTFEPDAGGTRMRWSWEVKPKGVYRLLTPIIALVGRRSEVAIWTGLKDYLESTPTAQEPGDIG